jgi:hypothetical protein
MKENKIKEYNKRVFVNLIMSFTIILIAWCALSYLVLFNNDYNNIEITIAMIFPIITILGIIMFGVEYSHIKDKA